MAAVRGARRRRQAEVRPPGANLTWTDVRRRRLAAHKLTNAAPREDLVNVVGAVCGIHAQLLPTAELSIGLRVEGATRTTVREALWTERSLVKTFGLRGTIHVFPSTEHAAWLAALRALPAQNDERRLEAIGLSRRDVDRLIDVIAEVLTNRRLTLVDLEHAVAERVGAWAAVPRGEAFGGGWSRVRSVLGDAALAGVLCFGPNEGTRVTYVRPDECPGPRRTVPADDALAMLVRRYLTAFGPATPTDFREWTNTSPTRAAAAFESVSDELVEVSVAGWRGVWLRSQLDDNDGVGQPRDGADEPVVHLLPHFDSYLVGSRPRDELVPHAIQAAVAPRGLKRYDLHAPLPVLLIDGRVAGLWHRTVKSRSVVIRVEPLVELSAAARGGIDSAADRVAAVLERSPSLEIGPVDARPHL